MGKKKENIKQGKLDNSEVYFSFFLYLAQKA